MSVIMQKHIGVRSGYSLDNFITGTIHMLYIIQYRSVACFKVCYMHFFVYYQLMSVLSLIYDQTFSYLEFNVVYILPYIFTPKAHSSIPCLFIF